MSTRIFQNKFSLPLINDQEDEYYVFSCLCVSVFLCVCMCEAMVKKKKKKTI